MLSLVLPELKSQSGEVEQAQDVCLFSEPALTECLVIGRADVTFPQHPHPRRGDEPCGGKNGISHSRGRDLSRKTALNPN